MNERGARVLPEIEFVGGGAQEYLFHSYFSPNGRPFDLEGCTASFAVTSVLNRYGEPVISKAMTVVEGDGQTNLLRVVLEPEDTVGLAGKYLYQITVRGEDGKTDPPAQGEMVIHNNIDKRFVMGRA